MGAQFVNPPGNGPYCFRVHGQIYHQTSHVHPAENKKRSYAQLYVIDSEEANRVRLGNAANENCNEDVMKNLDSLIREINPYSRMYKILREVELEELENSIINNIAMPKVNLVIRRDRTLDRRRYNAPSADEIAMVFRNNDGEPPFERDIKIYPRPDVNQNTQVSLNILSPNLDPMTYVLFYPYGQAGWQPNMAINRAAHENARRINITMLQWKVAQIFHRQELFNPILHGGKLFQQWVVDSYLQVEANNLNFIKTQQSKLRVEQYRGLMDHLNSEHRGATVGRIVILPSSFQGSPRNQRERYYDAMAIVGKYGKPDLFITITCNPNWIEIKSNLYSGQKPCDRPDLVARVFKIKLIDLMDDILKKNIFGIHIGYMYTIEFQKRGLPHAHILIILEEQYKPNTVEIIDRIVCAELPDQENEPGLFNIVTKCMIHGPCGEMNPNAPCMENGMCIKNYPKPFKSEKEVNVNGYPSYRRREQRAVQIGKFPITNQNVVPYNKYLCKKYNCHINVEVCTSIKSVKYIFKYIYKGYDCANVEIQTNEYDEIKNYLSARYVSAPEATWRLLENKMHDRSHAIIRLAVHLDQEQIVYFREGEEDMALNRASNRDTQLTAWFKLNAIDQDAQRYLYTEIPYHYIFKDASKKWERRKRGANKIIPRIYSVSPKNIELFYLRLLLLNIRGAKSFEELRTVDGVICSTFREAACKLNLLETDEEWYRCMREACNVSMPAQLRNLFALICIFNNPNNPNDLWEQFSENMMEDYIIDYTADISKRRALQDIEKLLTVHGLNCTALGLPDPGPVVNSDIEYNNILESQEAENRIKNLNYAQRFAFNTVINAIEKEGENSFFFLDGPGGSGKTYLYNTIMSFLRGKNKAVLAAATTGIAADILKGGRTVHSCFKLPIPLVETSVSTMKINSVEAQKLKKISLIIIDEVSMLSSHALRCIDILLREITGKQCHFGGKVLLLGGDFRQIANVVPRGTKSDVEACIKSSYLWDSATILKLDKNMRSEGQDIFNKWILAIGDGLLSNNVGLDQNFIEIPEQYLVENNIIDAIYGNRIDVTNLQNLNKLSKKIILTTTNSDAIVLNNKILQLISKESKEYKSIDSIETDDEETILNYPTEFLNTVTPSGMPPHKLILKIGTIIMLIRNLNPQLGLLNGTRLIVQNLFENFIESIILTGSNKGAKVFIPRMTLMPSDSNLPFKLKRRQFPFILAFAITINKSQGQSFDSVGVYKPENIFSHGQLYVAVSRTRKNSNLKIYTENAIQVANKVYIKNIVIDELLQ